MDQSAYLPVHGASPRLTQEALFMIPKGETAGEPAVSLPSVYVPPPRNSEPKDEATVFEYGGSDYTPPGKGPASATRWSWPRKPRREAPSDQGKSDPASNKLKAWNKYREWARNRLNHDGQLHDAVHRAQDEDRRHGLRHPDFGTIDRDAVSSVRSWATRSHASLDEAPPQEDAVPACLPRHRQLVRDAKTLARYLAASAYTVSLAGPPLADMQYGVVIVPCGQEELFFREQPEEEPAYERPAAAAAAAGRIRARRAPRDDDTETSMGSTAFRFFDRQRLLDTWREDRWNAEVREERRKVRVEELLVPPEPWDAGYASELAPRPRPWTSEGEGEGGEQPRVSLRWDDDDSDSPGRTACATGSGRGAEEATGCVVVVADLGLDELAWQVPASTAGWHRDAEVEEEAGSMRDDAAQQSAPSSSGSGRAARANGSAVGLPPTARELLSDEGRVAIEALLRGAGKEPAPRRRKPKRRSIRDLLRRKRAAEADSAMPGGAVSPLVLREVAAVAKMIADGSVMENPGIDDGLWRAVQQGLRSR